MRLLLILISFLTLAGSSVLQAQHVYGVPTFDDSVKVSSHFRFHKDSTLENISQFFTQGHVGGYLRNSSMATINEGALKDYWTNATGGSISFRSAEWKGLQVGMTGNFSFNTLTSDLNELDPLVDQGAKWEREMYDVRRPELRWDLNRLDELYLRFNTGNSNLSYGRLNINEGPLFLQRDGRMNAFVYQGLWVEINEYEGHELKLGLINGASPRGYTEWFSLNDLIGLQSRGKQPNGQTSDYLGTSGIKAIYTLGYENTLVEGLKVKAWNYLFDKQSNISWLQFDFTNHGYIAGLQYVHQQSTSFQEGLEYEERYMQPDEQANVFNVKFGYTVDRPKGSTEWTASYLKALDTGRFLFPRELGREDFYVSQPRSWIDGWGDVDVFMLRMRYKVKTDKGGEFFLDTRLSRTEAPEPTDRTFNKYGVSSFYQATVFPTYRFSGKWKGMDIGLLYIYKYTEDEIELTASQTFYNTNLHHFNLIANLHF